MAQDVVKSSTLTTPTIGIELNGLPTRNSESNIGLFHTTSRTSHHTLRDKAVLGGGDEEAPQLTPTLTTATVAHSFPDGGLRAWLVVFGSSLTIFTTWGLVNSIGVFQSYWQAHQLSHLEPTAIGWISSVNIFLNLFLGVQIGPLFDRYGSRWLMLTGSVSYVVSLVCLAECKEYWQFMLTWGVLAGVASTMLTTVSISVVAHWFEVKRGQASGVTFIGSSVGGVLFPLALEPMLEKLGWAWSMRIVALLVAVGLVIGNICVKGRLPKGKRGGAIDLRCFSDIRFSMATVGVAGVFLAPAEISGQLF
jgi:MFS family permease